MSSLTRISLTLVLALSFWGLRGVVLAQSESVGSTSNETTFAPIFSNAEGRAPFQPGLMRVDVSLSSSTPTSWDGEFRLSRGEFADLVPLGSNATSPTEFLFSDSTQSRLTLSTRTPTTFCGVEATIFAPRDARLEVKLRDRQSGKTFAQTIFVDRLLDSAARIQLDNQGGGLEVVRTSADDLPVRITRISGTESQYSLNARETTVFQPTDKIILETLPRLSSVNLPDEMVLTATARTADSQEPFWSESRSITLVELQHAAVIAGDKSAPHDVYEFMFPVPVKDGVFEIVLELTNKTSDPLKTTFVLPSTSKKRTSPTTYARRVIQGVVVTRTPDKTERVSGESASLDSLRADLLETIDPTNPSWFKNYSKRSIIPFHKPNSKNGKKLFTSAEETNVEYDEVTVPSPSKTFASVSPSSPSKNGQEAQGERIFLAQESNEYTTSVTSAPLGKNLLGLVPSVSGKGKANELAAAANERLDFLKRWESDHFHTFLRNLDNSDWGIKSDLWEKALSSGSSRPFNENELAKYATAQSRFMRLAPNRQNSDPSDVNDGNISWEAYPIPIETVGIPYILEVEYPANFPQKLGISILEQNALGALFPTALDVGLTVGKDELTDRANNEIARFTTLFWPQTNNPIILFSNCSDKTAAAYGQIRIYRAAPVNANAGVRKQGRTFGTALTTPDLCGQFSAARKPSPFGVTGAEDWNTFEDSLSRSLYYLSAANIDSMVLSVVSNGSTLYPSKRLNPSPAYDRGVFLPSGGDPVRKDVLTLAMTRFETQRKRLIPLVQLNGTVPALEYRLNALNSNTATPESRAAFEGIEWIGADRRKLIDSRRKEDGSGPYYNVLHPEVEKEVLAIIRELVAECSSFDSFDGLALDVGANGWLALPDDIYYGMDDETIARFVRESNLQEALSRKGDRRVQELLLAKGNERYRARALFIHDVCLNEWLEWRTEALYSFYTRVRLTIAEARPDVRLYLVATTALDGPVCRSMLYPSLTNPRKAREALRLVGLDPVRFGPEPKRRPSAVISQVGYDAEKTRKTIDNSITLLRPEIVAGTISPIPNVLQDGMKDPETVSLFARTQAYPGAFFFHQAQRTPLYDFDKVSPVHPTVVELQTKAMPAGYENKRRFARALALEDVLCFFDGGASLPMGQEETLYDWINVYKNLPNAVFRTWSPKSEANIVVDQDSSNSDSPEEKTIQPLVVRYYRTEKETWIYFLNAAPFHLGVKLALKRKSNARFEVFAGDRYDKPNAFGESLDWNFTAAPYDLAAICVEDPNVTFESIEVSRPSEICGPEGRLQNAVQDFVDRALVSRSGVAVPLRNGSFEESLTPSDGVQIDEQSAQSTLEEERNSESAETDRTNLFGVDVSRVKIFQKRHDDEKTPKSEAETVVNPPFDPARIPGWRTFGPNDVDVRLDQNVAHDGHASLRVTSQNNTGGVICQPFDSPTTGRIFAQIYIGVPDNVQELPLNVCLVGRYNGSPFNRRIYIGKTALKQAQKLDNADSDNGVVWVREVVSFDGLPLEGLDDLSLRFELCGAGTVWLDQIRIYKLAFADVEQTELMKLINMAEYRASKDRTFDVLVMLDSYWAKMLKEQIADDSPLLESRPRRPSSVTLAPDEETDNTKTPGFFDRTINKIKFW